MSIRMRIVAAGRAIARAWGYVPIRLPGIALAVVAIAAMRFAQDRVDYVMFAVGLAGFALLGLCLLFTVAGTLALRYFVGRAVEGAALDIETRRPSRTGFRFRRLRAWPLIDTKMVWEHPAAVDVELRVDGAFADEVIVARERGRHVRVVRRFTVEDIFGLTAVSFRKRTEHKMRFLPARTTAGVEIAFGHATGDAFSHPEGRLEGDLIEMRKYGRGDPLRHILWKTYARTRRLLVRMPERAIAPSPTTSAFLVAGEGDEAAAATARLYLETGLLGSDFVFGADGSPGTTTETDEALEQIIDSIAARADNGRGLDGFRRAVDPVHLGRCVVFAPPIAGDWCERVAAFSRNLASPATVIIGIEGGLDGDRRRRMISRALFRPPPAAASSSPRRDLPKIRAALEAGGMNVKVLHRETGKLL
jgi:hypothetical protein